MDTVSNFTVKIQNNSNQGNETSRIELNISSTDSSYPSNILSTGESNNQSIFYYLVGICGLLLNTYVIIVVALSKSMHKKPTNIYILNQSILDGLASILFVLQTCFPYNGSSSYAASDVADEFICRLWYPYFPLWSVMDSSSYNIVALTFERYLAIVHPIWYKTKFSNNRIKIWLSIVFVWFIGIAYNASYLIPSTIITASGACFIYDYPGQWAQIAVGITTFVFEFFVPALIIIAGYSAIALSLHKRSKIKAGLQLGNSGEARTSAEGFRLCCFVKDRQAESCEREGGAGINLEETCNEESKENSSNKDQFNESMVRARTSVLKTCALIASFFIICWSSNEVFFLAYNLSATCCLDLQSWFSLISRAMIPLNCCTSPIIYSLTYSEFKKGAASLFTRQKKKSSVLNPSAVSVQTTGRY